MGIPKGHKQQQNMSLSHHGRPPCFLHNTPVNAPHQHGKLRVAQANLALARCGPHKAPTLKAFGEKACTLTIPPYDFDLISTTASELKQMARVRITLKNLLRLSRQPVKPAPHVRHTRSKPDLCIRQYGDHATSPRASSRTNPASTPSLTLSLRPFSSVISIRGAGNVA